MYPSYARADGAREIGGERPKELENERSVVTLKVFFRFYIVLFSCPIAFYFSTFSSISGLLLQRTACVRPTSTTAKNEDNQTLLKEKKVDNRASPHTYTCYAISLSHINTSMCVRYVTPPSTNYSFPRAIKILTFLLFWKRKGNMVLYTVCTLILCRYTLYMSLVGGTNVLNNLYSYL